MKILFPFVPEAVRPESMTCMQSAVHAGHDVRFRELHGEFAYWEAMCEMFREGEAFLNCEHDIEITLQQISDIEACDQPICAFGYPMQQEGDILPALFEWVEASANRRHADAAQACKNHVRFTIGLGATRFSEAVVKQAAPGFLAATPVTFKWLDFGLQNHIAEYVGHFHEHDPGVGVRHW